MILAIGPSIFRAESASFSWHYRRRFRIFPSPIRTLNVFSNKLSGIDRSSDKRWNISSISKHESNNNCPTIISARSLVQANHILTNSITTKTEHTFIETGIRYMRTSSKKSVDLSTITFSTRANNEQNNQTTKQKAKRFLQKYGTVFIGTYFSIYFATLFSTFGLLEGGFLDPDLIGQIFKVSKDLACETADVIGPPGSGSSMDEAATAYAEEISTEMTREKRSLVEVVTGYLQNYEWSAKYAEKMEQNPHLANLAVAWFMVKFTEPVRLAAAFVIVPKVAKAVGRKVPKDDIENNQ